MSTCPRLYPLFRSWRQKKCVGLQTDLNSSFVKTSAELNAGGMGMRFLQSACMVLAHLPGVLAAQEIPAEKPGWRVVECTTSNRLIGKGITLLLPPGTCLLNV